MKINEHREGTPWDVLENPGTPWDALGASGSPWEPWLVGAWEQPATRATDRQQPERLEIRAAGVLDNLNPEVPFASRLEYVKSIAAIKQLYHSHLHRPTSDGKTTLGGILVRAVEWKNIEYFANAAKWRNMNEISREEMVHGTVGNEAEHADMKAWAQNVFLQTCERAFTSLKAWVLSKILRHESSLYSPKRLSWDNAGCEWLSRVLAKATNPACRLSDVPPLRRAGFGRSEDLRKPSVPWMRRPTVVKKPGLKRPASSSGAQHFEGVWKRPSTRVCFTAKWSV